MKESVVMVQTNISSALQHTKIAEMYNLISAESTQEAFRICQEVQKNVASIILGSDIIDPIQTTQRLYGIDKSISVIILATENNVVPMRKSINFTPFLGHSTVCLSESDVLDLEKEIVKSINANIRSRQARNLSNKLNTQLSGITADKHRVLTSSKEYLERLFDSAPIGIMTLTADGHFLALNKASSEMFGITEHKFIGASIQQVLPELNLVPDRVESISKMVHNELRHFDVTITTVNGQDQSPGYLLLVVDTTDRKTYEKALESAVRVRDEFLSIASHELKTPITSLQLQLQITKRSIGPEAQSASAILAKIAKSTDVALVQVQRLTILIEDLLDVSKIETGKLSFNFGQVNVNELLSQIIERLSQQALSAKCDIKLDVPLNLTFISDPFRLDQIFTNLMVNAFKYAAGKPVELKVTEQADSLQFSLKDYGMGIETSKLSIIFKRFERGISNHNISGLGLGLYITRNLVDALGGSISVESKLGEGTTFTVTLPRKQKYF